MLREKVDEQIFVAFLHAAPLRLAWPAKQFKLPQVAVFLSISQPTEYYAGSKCEDDEYASNARIPRPAWPH